MIIAFLFFANAYALVIPDFSSDLVLGELWYKQEIYFRPAKAGDLNWNGLMLHYPSKKCFDLKQADPAAKVSYRDVQCDADFAAKANVPYVKIAEFGKFKAAFLECVDREDQKCLRGFISKTLQISMGLDGYRDRRDLFFDGWKKEDYRRLGLLIKKGTYQDGAYMKFPPKAGAGQRGAFELYDGGWLLESYMAGD